MYDIRPIALAGAQAILDYVAQLLPYLLITTAVIVAALLLRHLFLRLSGVRSIATIALTTALLYPTQPATAQLTPDEIRADLQAKYQARAHAPTPPTPNVGTIEPIRPKLQTLHPPGKLRVYVPDTPQLTDQPHPRTIYKTYDARLMEDPPSLNLPDFAAPINDAWSYIFQQAAPIFAPFIGIMSLLLAIGLIMWLFKTFARG